MKKIITGEYNENGYEVFMDGASIYSAGNAAEDSQGVGTTLSLRVIRKYAIQTTKEIAKERGGVFSGVTRIHPFTLIDQFYRRMSEKAEMNRVHLVFVEPAYSSQTFSSCGAIDKKSRNGEVFKCTACGHADDADANGAKNILQRFLDGHFTVARGTQRA